jgi:hypothetical protein
MSDKMTKKDYYNRKTEMDWIEEHSGGMKDCRNLILVVTILWAAIALAIIFLAK